MRPVCSPDFSRQLSRNGGSFFTAVGLTTTLLLGLVLAASACTPSLATTSSVPSSTRAAPFSWTAAVTVTTDHPALQSSLRQPQAAPVATRMLSAPPWRLEGLARAIPSMPDVIWLDLFVINDSDQRANSLQLAIASPSPVIDVSKDPFAKEPLTGPLTIAGVAPQGIAQRSLLIPRSNSPFVITIEATGQWSASTAAEVNSTPIMTSPDGSEVWAALGDADTVAVVSTANRSTTDRIAVTGHPTGVTMTSDGQLVLVTSPRINQVSVIDRSTRQIIQVLGEADGIGREPRHIIMSPDGVSAYVSAYVGDTITRLQRVGPRGFAVTGHLDVGRRPLGMALSADGRSLFVSHFLPRGIPSNNETWVSAIETASFKLAKEVIWRDTGNLREASCLADKIGGTPEQLQFEGVATQLAGVFLPPGGGMGWIPGLRTGPVAIWEFAPDKQFPGVARSTFSPAFLFFMDTDTAASAGVRLSPLVLDVPDAPLDFLRCAKLDYDTESVVATEVPGEPGAIYSNGAAVPTGATALSETGVGRFVAFTPGGRRALVLSHTADELQVFDAVTQQNISRRNLRLSGSNPIGMSLSADGRTGYVLYENSLFLSILDLTAYADPQALPATTYIPFEYRITDNPNNSFLTASRLVRFVSDVPEFPDVREAGTISLLAADPVAAPVRRGKILFQSSNPEKYPELSGSRQSSCATCHPGGGHDGTVWGTMEGERRTMSLYGGVSGRGWLHQSGTHADAREFVSIIVPERLGGTGLTNDDYDAMAEYVGRHIPKLQGPAVDLQSAARGQVVFGRACASCHAGPTFSGGMPDPDSPWGGGSPSGPLLVDVGTATATSGVLIPSFFTSRLPSPSRELYDLIRGDRDLGPRDPVEATLGFRPRPERKRGLIRPPSLIGAWDYSVFFHNGQVDSLGAVMQHLNEALGLRLTQEELNDVMAYVKTL